MDFEPWRWSALNLGFVDKHTLRMQRQFYLWKSGGAGRSFQSGFEVFNFLGDLPGGAESKALALIHLSLKVRRGEA